MAIALRNAASTTFDSGAGTHANITVSKPTGTVDGDVMLAGITTRESVTVTAPAGWTNIAEKASTTTGNTGTRTTVFRKVASSEGASYQFNYSSTVDDGACAVVLAFSGVNNTTPEDATPTTDQTDTTTDTTINIPSITTVTDNAWHVYFAGENPLSGSTTPVTHSQSAGYTEDFDSAVKSNVTVTLRVALSAGHKGITPAGATTAFDVTTTNDGRNTGISVALRPDLTQTVTLTGLSSGEAFGSPRVDLNITLTGITSAEAFGSLEVDEGVSLTGIASAEAFGALQVDLTLLFTGIVSSETFGTLRVDEGIALTGIASSEAFGSLRVDLTITLTGITSGEAFGSSAVGRTVVLTGLPSAESFGTLALISTVDVYLFGFFEESFGFLTFKEPDWWNDVYPFRRKIVLTAPTTEALPPNHPINVTLPVTSGRRSDYIMPEVLAYSPPHLMWLGRELVDTGDTLSVRFLTVGTVLPGEQATYYVYYGHVGGIGRPTFTDNPWPVRVGQDSSLISYSRPTEHWKNGSTVVAGAKASVSVAAVDLRVTAETGLEQGIAEIQIDEGLWAPVDLFARAGVDESEVFRTGTLSEDIHRVRYRASGRSNPASRGSQVNVVAFEYVLPVTVLVETEEGYVSHG